MKRIWEWMAGRKTYLVAGTVLFALAVLVFLAKLTPDAGVGLVTVAVCGFGATFRHALERHQREEIAILSGIAEAGRWTIAHNVPSAAEAIVATLPQGVKLAEEIQHEDGQ